MMDNNVPSLRFKEFSGKWEKRKLKDITTRIGDGLHSTPNYNDNGDYYFINGNNLINGKIEINDSTKRVDKVEYDKHKRNLSSKTILLSINGTIGNLARYDNEKVILGKSAAYINTNNDILIKDFLFQYFQTNNIKSYFLNSLTGTTIKNLGLKSISDTIINLPTVAEQEKIANYLSALDEKINLLSEKEKNLAQYKKAMMQKLFAQEIRFKDDEGKAFEDWEEKQLGEVLDYIQPTKYIVDSTEYSDKYTIPVLTAGKSFILGYTNEDNNIFKDIPVIIFDDFTTAFKYVDFNFKVKSSAMKILKTKELNLNLKYIYAAMNLIKFPVSDHKRYWISEYQNIYIPYPCVAEQEKIANFLSAIDEKINAVQKQIAAMQAFKKAMLQQMFV